MIDVKSIYHTISRYHNYHDRYKHKCVFMGSSPCKPLLIKVSSKGMDENVFCLFVFESTLLQRYVYFRKSYTIMACAGCLVGEKAGYIG